MRNAVSVLLLPLAFALSACGLTDFDIPVKGTFTVEAGEVDPNNGKTLELPDNFKELRLQKTKEFEDSGFGMKDVSSVKLTSAKLKVLTAGASLDFLTSATFYVESPGHAKQAVGRIPAGSIAAGATTVDVDVLDVDLKKYATADVMTVSAEAERDAVESDVQIEFKAVFSVDVL